MSPHEQWDDYNDFVKGFPILPNFNADEFLYLGGSHNDSTSRCANLNWYPPRSLWPSVYALAGHVQNIRDEFGGAIMMTSVYRDEDYNSCIGGARHSYHKQGMAGDMIPVNGNVAGLWKAADLLTPHGGVGRYSSFVHVDIRGRRARW